jgi:predicted CoA-binding protein
MKTLVFGGSLNPERYSNIAIKRLEDNDIEVVSYGLRAGLVGTVPIDTSLEDYDDIHTITLYMNPKRQREFYTYLVGLNPQRIIMNPGTENNELATLAKEQNIEVVEACTLVMLSTNQY